MGTRLSPLTDNMPKPVIKINGTPMIETMINGLHQNGIHEIYVVVGYLKEQLDYLPKKYPGLTLLQNPHYQTHNNISSLYIARNHLQNTILCDGDLVLKNPAILNPHFEFSGYCSTWTDLETNEWVQTLDADDFVSNCTVGGKAGWQVHPVSFWSKEDGLKLKKHLEELMDTHPQVFWDDIALFLRKDEYKLKVREINSADVIEIDTYEEYLAHNAVQVEND